VVKGPVALSLNLQPNSALLTDALGLQLCSAHRAAKRGR
jgi:hypothetical protein